MFHKNDTTRGLIYQTACKSPLKFHLRRKGKTCVRPKYIHSFQMYQTLRTRLHAISRDKSHRAEKSVDVSEHTSFPAFSTLEHNHMVNADQHVHIK